MRATDSTPPTPVLKQLGLTATTFCKHTATPETTPGFEAYGNPGQLQLFEANGRLRATTSDQHHRNNRGAEISKWDGSEMPACNSGTSGHTERFKAGPVQDSPTRLGHHHQPGGVPPAHHPAPPSQGKPEGSQAGKPGQNGHPEGQDSMKRLARMIQGRHRLSPGDGHMLSWNLQHRMAQSSQSDPSDESAAHQGAILSPRDQKPYWMNSKSFRSCCPGRYASPKRHRQATIIQIYA